MKGKDIISNHFCNYGGGRKRIFIGLLVATCAVICLGLLLFLIIPWLWEDAGFLPYISIFIGSAGIIALVWLCLALIVHIYTGKQYAGILKVRHIIIRLMLPLMEIVGRLCGLDKEIVRRSFIRVNNEFVLSGYRGALPSKILLLLPHCIQSVKCSRRLTYSLENCAHCGACQVGALQNLSKRYGFHLAIATGGTIARRIVVESRPDYIVAVACERDLTSGIQDSYPIPVFGILNERPNGPCRDTLVPVYDLCRVMAFFLGRKKDEVAACYRGGSLGRIPLPGN